MTTEDGKNGSNEHLHNFEPSYHILLAGQGFRRLPADIALY